MVSTASGRSRTAVRSLLLIAITFLASACSTRTVDVGQDSPEPSPGLTGEERVQAIHVLMHHGLSMASEGADLVMVSQLGMEPGLDERSLQHGQDAVSGGRRLIQRARDMARRIDADVEPGMIDYTNRLADSYLRVVDHLAGMRAPDPDSEQLHVHHMHMLLNHALRMGVDGANLRMLGGPGGDADVGRVASVHGDRMMENGRNLVGHVLGGESMDAAHERGLTGEAMQTAHDLARAIRDAFDLMERMPWSPTDGRGMEGSGSEGA